MQEKTVHTRIADLWRRLVDAHGATVDRWGEYGARRTLSPTETEIAELMASDGAATDQVGQIDVVLAQFSDYSGSSIDHANVRTLDAEFGARTVSGGGHGDCCAVITLGELPDSDDVTDGADRLALLVEVMEGLADYPLISDEAHSVLEMELANEAWSSYLWRDVRSDLIDHFTTARASDGAAHATNGAPTDGVPGGDGPGVDVPDVDDVADDNEDLFRNWYFDFEHSEWLCESATSAINLRHDDAVAYLIDRAAEKNLF